MDETLPHPVEARGDSFSPYSEQDVARLYPVLRRMAGEKMAYESPGNTLQPTALVHEAWMRLRSERNQSWRDSSHFCAAAAETMRRILINRARWRKRLKRGRDHERVSMSVAEEEPESQDDKTLLINDALERLGKSDPVRARLVLLKFFGGLSNKEIAVEMSVTERTVERYWAYARAWLYREIRLHL